MSQHDEINHPRHYELAPGLEAWDVIKATLTPAELRGYCVGQILKYRLRAGEKGDALKCIGKANWYRARLEEIEAMSRQMKEIAAELQRFADRLNEGITQQNAQAQEQA